MVGALMLKALNFATCRRERRDRRSGADGGLSQRAAQAVSRPGGGRGAARRASQQVQAIARWANENRVPLIPQGGNTGPRRRAGAASRRRGDRLAAAARQGARDQRAGGPHDGRGRRDPAACARGRRGRGRDVPAVAREPGIGADRRRARAPMPAACRCWPSAMRASCASASKRCSPMAGSIRGSTRSRRTTPATICKRPADRRRGHAGHHHGGDAEAVPASPWDYETAFCSVAAPRRRWSCST